MLFNSYIFVLAFLPVTLIGWFGLNKLSGKSSIIAKLFLIVASLVFYGYYNIWYLPVIILSVLINYAASSFLIKGETGTAARKAVFAFSLLVNVGSLFFFKYLDFTLGNINALFGSDFPLLNLALPLGISFFTFQQLSYVIDSYKGTVPKYNFIDYALFVTYFPQLIAGPIVTHDEMVPQFADRSKKAFNADSFSKGLFAFSIGLAKKVIIADTFGNLVNLGFEKVEELGSANAAIVMLAYTFQIYFDFSGYCDMATGIAKMMNIDITMNFNSPYKATSVIDFWKRWHITLTRFFTRYVYIPLGGNRKGEARTYLNIFIVFLVSGIWHGANWTFILWGVLHGLAQIATRFIDKKTGLFSKNSKGLKAVTWLLTFAFINLTWVIFRAESVSRAFGFFGELFSFGSFNIDPELLNALRPDSVVFVSNFVPVLGDVIKRFFPLVLIAFSLFAVVFMKNTNERITSFRPKWYNSLITAALTVVCILSFAGVSSFLYWNF